MVNNERSSMSNNTAEIYQKLNAVLQQMLETLDNSRGDIYEIAEDCRNQCANLRSRLEEAAFETEIIIQKVDKCERLDKQARFRLMEVSRNFKAFSELDIKDAYQKAQELQQELLELRQKELYLRKRRDDLSRELKKFANIADKADSYLHNTNLALKMLQGNIGRISDTLDDAVLKQQMGAWVVESMESERRKVARDLHDGPAQSLASMLIRLDLMEYLFDEDINRVMEELKNVKEMGRESLRDIRRIMFDLKPSAVTEVGLIATLRDYVQDYENKYNFDIDLVFFGKERRTDMAMEIALFRLAQEAITNVRKHSGTNKALLKIEYTTTGVTMVIKDEGKGFDVDLFMKSNQESYGILGMKERADIYGGIIQIKSNPGEGTQVIVEVPMEREGNSGEDKGFNSR